jgi:hypothetical protein
MNELQTAAVAVHELQDTPLGMVRITTPPPVALAWHCGRAARHDGERFPHGFVFYAIGEQRWRLAALHVYSFAPSGLGVALETRGSGCLVST